MNSCKLIFLGLLLGLTVVSPSNAQNPRIQESNQIGWYQGMATLNFSKKWGMHTEYQWRRTDFIENPQQGLLRVGINYNASPRVQLRLGYAWVETFAYGETPLNGFGKDFTEHRIFQQATLQDPIGFLQLSHRFMLEQRWIGRYTSANLETEDDYLLIHRFRYMLRAQTPITFEKNPSKNVPYVALYNEIFIGFGKDIGENVFDQNRFGAVVGYKITPNWRLEAGYLNQTLQLGREVNGQNVFQNNNGFTLQSNITLDFSKKN